MSLNQDVRPPQPEGSTIESPLPTIEESPYLRFTQVGAHWRGCSSLRNLFVFGDSYSSKMSDLWGIGEEDPTTDGNDTTWVDLLVSSLSSRSTVVRVNNFAFPGATVEYDLSGQLAWLLDPISKKALEPRETTFVFFLGINDCGGIPGEDLSSLVDVVFDAIHRLYIDANARNFILVDVPPTDRSPAAAGTTIDIASRIEEWNDSLVTHASDFVSNSTQTTMLVFSSHKVLSEILDNPGAHGFAENAKSVVGRGIWWDSLHLTPAVHRIIANRISSVLGC